MGVGEVGLEPDRRAVCGDGLVAACPGLRKAMAEVVVGLWRRSGLSRIAVADSSASGLVVLAWVRRAMPRLEWVLASSGLSRIAVRNSAIASSSLPWSRRALPRLMWAMASSGLSRIAVRYSAIASSCLPWPQGDAEVVVGLGVSGLSRIALRYSAIASSSLPWSAGRCRGCSGHWRSRA